MELPPITRSINPASKSPSKKTQKEIMDNVELLKENFSPFLQKMNKIIEILSRYKNGMPSKLVRKIFLQLNAGLKEMIKKGKTHRDLKPSNILFSYTNEKKNDFIIKIGDFGLATDMVSTVYASNTGTVQFKAPEVDKGKVSNKCDLYSLGIILYMLKTGEYIFEGKNIYEILTNKKANKMKKDTDDEILNKLIKKLVVIEPRDRISWDAYFDDPFFNVDDDVKENKECKSIN